MATFATHTRNFNAQMMGPLGQRKVWLQTWAGHEEERQHLQSLAWEVVQTDHNVGSQPGALGQIMIGLNHPGQVNTQAASAAQAHLDLNQYITYLIWQVGLDNNLVMSESTAILAKKHNNSALP